MRRLLIILFVFCAPLFAVGCANEECKEPATVEKIEERTQSRLDDWMDTADAYENQRDRVKELTAELKDDRIRLTRMREVARDQVLDELLKPVPSEKAMHKMVDDSKRAMMPYNYKVMDQVMEAHKAFTTEQRQKIADKLAEKPDPFELSFIVRTGIDYVLYQIDATDSQKKTIWAEIEKTGIEVNSLIDRQHKITKVIAAEWASKDADAKIMRREVDRSADGFTAFIKKLTTKAAIMTKVLTPKQREYTNDRIRRGKTCKG